MTKICSKCKIEKDISEFCKTKKYKDGLNCQCKKCQREYRREHVQEIKKYQKEYRKQNKQKLDKYFTGYRENNRKEINIKQRKRDKKRYQEDINFKLVVLLRCRLRMAIKKNQKNGSAIKNLGCTVEFFRQYLESKFQEGMTWNNHGKWHIDHIIPLSSFDLTDKEQFLKACHYTNLQPLWAVDNIRKSNKY